MIKNIFKGVAAIIAFLAVIQLINQSGNSGNETYQAKVMSIEEIEHSKSTEFLSIIGNYNENLWGDKIRIRGKIKNSATVASYKDIVVKVIYYSKTQTVLKTEDYTIYEVISPHSQKSFDLRVPNHKNVKTINIQVVNALPYY